MTINLGSLRYDSIFTQESKKDIINNLCKNIKYYKIML